MGTCGILETFLTDIAIEFIASFPGELVSKQFSLEALVKNGSSGLLRETAEKEINEISYGPFPEMLNRLQEIFHFKTKMNEQLVKELNEVKCTRDVYVHGNGRANHIYLRKTGDFARVRLDSTLPLGDKYLEAAIGKSEQFVKEFFAHIPPTYLELTPVKAFREMWECSHLNRIIPFDKAWEGGGRVVRPTDFALEWHWSSSEKALFDFFLAIFSSNHEKRTSDFNDAMFKWPPSTPEAQIMMSWWDSPFWF